MSLRMRFAQFVVFCSVLPILSVYAMATTPQTYKTLSLNEAIRLALRFNPQIQIEGLTSVTQKYNLAVAKNQYEWQYALNGSALYSWNKSNGYGSAGQTHNLQPSASLNTGSGANINVAMNNNISNPNGSNNPSSYNPGVSVNITQPLMRGFGPTIALSPLADAYDQEKINHLTQKQTVINTILQVALDYQNILLAKQNVKTQQITVDDVQKRLHDNRLKVAAGVMPPSDNIQAQADLASAQLGLTSAQYAYTQSRLTFLNDIGVAPSEPLDVADTIATKIYPLPPLERVKNDVLASDVTYQTLLINHRMNQRALLKAKDDQRAQLNLTASGTTGNGSGPGTNANINSLINHANEAAAIGLTLSVPIDDMAVKQELLNAKVQISQDDINIRSQQWTLESSATNALNNLASLQTQLGFAKDSVEQQQKTLAIATQKMHYGLGSALDISTQQKNLNQAQLNYNNTQISYLNTWLQFRQLTGKTLSDFGVTILY